MNFKHLILTRFNTGFDGPFSCSPEWLDHRFGLFERFCLPSVLSQTRRDFDWLIFAHPETPPPFRARLESLSSDPRIRLCLVRRPDDIFACAARTIPDSCSHLITTSLDNDDAIGTRYIEHIQDKFQGQDFEILNFTTGYRLAVRAGKLYRNRVAGPNPFVSLIEKAGSSVHTIRRWGNHSQLVRLQPMIRNIESDPQWIQVIHGRNLAATGVWGWTRVPVARLAGSFDLRWPPQVLREGRIGIEAENIRRAVERGAMRLISPQRRQALRFRLARLRK